MAISGKASTSSCHCVTLHFRNLQVHSVPRESYHHRHMTLILPFSIPHSHLSAILNLNSYCTATSSFTQHCQLKMSCPMDLPHYLDAFHFLLQRPCSCVFKGPYFIATSDALYLGFGSVRQPSVSAHGSPQPHYNKPHAKQRDFPPEQLI